jgi:hypothetical protein
LKGCWKFEGEHKTWRTTRGSSHTMIMSEEFAIVCGLHVSLDIDFHRKC